MAIIYAVSTNNTLVSIDTTDVASVRNLGSLPSNVDFPEGATYHTGHVYIVDNRLGHARLWRINPDDPDDESGDFGFVQSFVLAVPPPANPHRIKALASDGTTLYGISDFARLYTISFTRDGGATLSSSIAIGPGTVGAAVHLSQLYVGDFDGRRIVNPDDGTSGSVAAWPSDLHFPGSLVSDGPNLYVIDSSNVYRILPQSADLGALPVSSVRYRGSFYIPDTPTTPVIVTPEDNVAIIRQNGIQPKWAYRNGGRLDFVAKNDALGEIIFKPIRIYSTSFGERTNIINWYAPIGPTTYDRYEVIRSDVLRRDGATDVIRSGVVIATVPASSSSLNTYSDFIPDRTVYAYGVIPISDKYGRGRSSDTIVAETPPLLLPTVSNVVLSIDRLGAVTVTWVNPPSPSIDYGAPTRHVAVLRTDDPTESAVDFVNILGGTATSAQLEAPLFVLAETYHVDVQIVYVHPDGYDTGRSVSSNEVTFP